MRTRMEIIQKRINISLSRHVNALYGYAMVLAGDPSVAADLVQETCLRARKACASLPSDGDLKGWLMTILRNAWLNQFRRRQSVPAISRLDAEDRPVEEAIETSKSPLAFCVSKLDRDRVREAVLTLPIEFREIILLREYEELSCQQIATILHCPVRTVMSRLAMARLKLHAVFSPSATVSGKTVLSPIPPACPGYRSA
jgi:RNA polymerase sigma-70 factor, ECF subfamily